MDPEGSLTIHWPDSMDSNEVQFLHQNTLIPSTLRQHESAALIDRRPSAGTLGGPNPSQRRYR